MIVLMPNYIKIILKDCLSNSLLINQALCQYFYSPTLSVFSGGKLKVYGGKTKYMTNNKQKEAVFTHFPF